MIRIEIRSEALQADDVCRALSLYDRKYKNMEKEQPGRGFEKMKKGQIAEGIVEKVVFPNKGIVAAEGEKVVVKNSVPGQKVRFSVNKIKHGKAEGRLLEVVEPSPLEVPSPCPHFGVCGGCTYQTLPYEEQLKLKAAQVKALLDDVISDYTFEGIKASPQQEAYRNKMEFSFGDEYKDGPLALGMHKRGSFYDIVTVDGCCIVDEDYRKILRCIRDYFSENAVPFYHKQTRQGYLRHLLVRKGVKTGDILIDLVTTSQLDLSDVDWVSRVLTLELSGTVVGILHTYNDSVADAVKDEGTKVVYGSDHFYEELLGLKFKISPFSFFQTNSRGAEVLYETARSYVGETQRQDHLRSVQRHRHHRPDAGACGKTCHRRGNHRGSRGSCPGKRGQKRPFQL